MKQPLTGENGQGMSAKSDGSRGSAPERMQLSYKEITGKEPRQAYEEARQRLILGAPTGRSQPLKTNWRKCVRVERTGDTSGAARRF